MRGASFVRVVHVVRAALVSRVSLVSFTALVVSMNRASNFIVRGTDGSGSADVGVSSRCFRFELPVGSEFRVHSEPV